MESHCLDPRSSFYLEDAYCWCLAWKHKYYLAQLLIGSELSSFPTSEKQIIKEEVMIKLEQKVDVCMLKMDEWSYHYASKN